jgi:hypothetical protein
VYSVRSHGVFDMALRFTIGVFLAGWLAAGACGQVVEEYQVKAAFLYNFARFVDWPAQSFKAAGDPITICVVGENPFGGALDEATDRKTVAGRGFAIRQTAAIGPDCDCQILFISASERRRFRSILDSLKPVGILTVGEIQGFAAEGGVVNFKLEGGKVRFEINIEAAERQQLHISSKLLSLAQIVKTARH